MGEIQKVETKEAPAAVGPYSQGTLARDFVFVSGQLPVDPKTGRLVEKDIKTQTGRVIDNIEAVLKEAGLSLSRVVRCDVFLSDMNDFKAMNEVYGSKFAADFKPVAAGVPSRPVAAGRPAESGPAADLFRGDVPGVILSWKEDRGGLSQDCDAFFYGSIAEFRIYNSALSPTEVQDSFSRGPEQAASGPLTHVKISHAIKPQHE